MATTPLPEKTDGAENDSISENGDHAEDMAHLTTYGRNSNG